MLADAFLPALLAALAIVGQQPAQPDGHRAGAGQRIQSALADLAAPRFRDREAASALLVEQGLAAAEALKAAEQHPDREVRDRARRALDEILRRERPRRLALLREDGPADEEALGELPGWPALSRYIGEGQSARRLLAEALEDNWDFLQALSEPGGDVDTIVSERCLELLQTRSDTRRVAGRGDIVAVMLGGLQAGSMLDEQTINSIFTVVHHAGPSISGVRTSLEDEAFRQLAGQLVLNTVDTGAAFRGLNLAITFDLSEGLQSAQRVLNREEPRANVKVFALIALLRFGDQHDLEIAARCLDDHQVYHVSQRIHQVNAEAEIDVQPESMPQYTVEVRDVALACLLHSHGQSIRDVGFLKAQQHANYVFNPSSLGFESPEERESAFSRGQQLLTN